MVRQPSVARDFCAACAHPKWGGVPDARPVSRAEERWTAMSGPLRLAPLLGLLVLGADAGADAITVPVIEMPCGTPSPERRCFGFQSDLITTFSQPTVDWALTPTLPEDPENWRLIGLTAAIGSSTYTLVYPNLGADLDLVNVMATFTDSAGRSFFSTGNVLQPICSEATSGEHAGKWVCSDGNSLGAPFMWDSLN